MIDLEMIKSQNSIGQVAVRLGLLNREPITAVAIHCPSPNHDDKHPSCMIMPHVNRFECKSCGISGDVINLVMLVQGSDFKAAIVWLGGDISLNNRLKANVNIHNKQEIHEEKDKFEKYTRDSYFEAHGINKEFQEQFNLHLSNYQGIPTAVIPNNKGEHHRCFGGENKFLTVGEVTLFKASEPEFSSKTIILAEGELDAIRIYQETGLSSWSGTGGCGTFKDEWIGFFVDFETIYLTYDNDESGIKGALKVAKKLGVERCRLVMIPKINGKDATDYFNDGKTKADFQKLLAEAVKASNSTEEEQAVDQIYVSNPKQKNKNENKTEKIIKLINTSELVVFLAFDKKVRFVIPEHPVIAYLSSSIEVGHWIRAFVYREMEETLEVSTLKTIISTLEIRAISSKLLVQTYIRTAYIKDRLYYNLGDGKRLVVISSKGYKVKHYSVNKPPAYFEYSPLSKVQFAPSRTGDIRSVLKLINIVDKKSEIIFLTTLIVWLFPHIPRAALFFIGPKGSAKSTSLKILKQLVDPSVRPLITGFKEIREVAIFTNHQSVLAIDNISKITAEVSDFLASFITEGGYVTRELYTDDQLMVFSRRPALGMTSIVSVVKRADLLDRSYILEHQPIKHRREESEVLAKFEQVAPEILSGMFSIASKVLSIFPSIRLENSPRMADHARYAAAAWVAMGGTVGEYENVLIQNLDVQNETALESSAFAQTIIALTDSWEDGKKMDFTPSELFRLLSSKADEMELTEDFPVASNKLNSHLIPIKENLESIGIFIKKSRTGDNRKWTIIKRKGNKHSENDFSSDDSDVLKNVSVIEQIPLDQPNDDSDNHDSTSSLGEK